jgi:hypothetical protein
MSIQRQAQAAGQQALVHKWTCRYKTLLNRFTLQEPAIALHGVLLGMVGSRLAQEQLCKAAKLAVKQGNNSYARCAMQRVSGLFGPHAFSEPHEWWLTDAKVLWHDQRRDQVIACRYCVNICMYIYTHAYIYIYIYISENFCSDGYVYICDILAGVLPVNRRLFFIHLPAHMKVYVCCVFIFMQKFTHEFEISEWKNNYMCMHVYKLMHVYIQTQVLRIAFKAAAMHVHLYK